MKGKRLLSLSLSLLMVLSCFAGLDFSALADEIDGNGECIEHDYVDTVVQPTHLEDGYIIRTCSRCGETYNAYSYELRAEGHIAGDAVIENRIEPTCTENGYYENVKYCTVCGEELERKTVNSEYDLVDSSLYPESPHYYLSNMNETYTFSYPHAETLVVEFSDLTQTEDGFDFIYLYDSKGNELGKFTGNALAGRSITINDNAFSVKIVSDTSVEDYGFAINSIYAATVLDELKAKGHTLSEYSSNNDATCTENGTKSATCSTCGQVITINDEDSALGHSYEVIETVSPTCYDRGYSVYYCAQCGSSYQADYQDVLEHDFVRKNQSDNCMNGGNVTSYCKRCGYTEEILNTSIGYHEYIAINNGDGIVTYKCIVCGEEYDFNSYINAYNNSDDDDTIPYCFNNVKSEIDYNTLYKFCTANKNSSNEELSAYCNETINALDAIETLYQSTNDSFNEANDRAIGLLSYEGEKYADAINAVYDYNYSSVSLEELGNIEIDGVKLKNVEDPELDVFVSYVKVLCDATGSNIVIENPADAFYYMLCDMGVTQLLVNIYLYIANLGGATITNEMYGGSDVLTPGNYLEKMSDILTLEAYCEMNGIDLDSADAAELEEITNEYNINKDGMCAQLVYQIINPMENGNDVFDSPYYEDIMNGLMRYADVYTIDELNEFKITDSQLADFAEYASTYSSTHSNNGIPEAFSVSQFIEYLNSDSCVFSVPMRKNLITIAESKDVTAFINAAVNNDVDAMKSASISFDSPFIDEKSFVEQANSLISSELSKDVFGRFISYGDVGNDPISCFVSYTEYLTMVLPTLNGYKFDYANYAIPQSVKDAFFDANWKEHIHSYIEEKIPATCTEDGLVSYECFGCGEKLSSEIIPATGHIDDNKDGICDNCSESLKLDTSVYDYLVDVVASLDENDYSADSFSALQSLIGSFDGFASQSDVDSACTEIIEAINALQPYLFFNLSSENGSANCSEASNTILYGTSVTLSATADDGYTFVGWYDTINNRYLSKSAEYTFKMTTNLDVKAIFVVAGASTLIFANESGWQKSSVSHTTTEWAEIASIKELLPEIPYKYGYSNGRWVYDDAEVLVKLQSGENVTLVPEYDKDASSMPTPRPSTNGTPALDLYFNYDAENSVGSFVMAAGFPEGIQVESVGIAFYYKNAKDFTPQDFTLLLNNKMLASGFNTDELEDTYIVNMNKMSSRYNWSVRGYVTYYNDQGKLVTAYSNQINIIDRQEVR